MARATKGLLDESEPRITNKPRNTPVVWAAQYGSMQYKN